MTPLRDALATALWHSPMSCDDGGPDQLMRDKADYALSDPAFRLVLTESIAEALHEVGKASHEPEDHYIEINSDEIAAAIVARMLDHPA